MESMWTHHLTFCGSNVISHFYCSDPPLIRLSCSDTYIKKTSVFLMAGFNLSNSSCNPHLLHLHSHCHPEDALCWRQAQSFSTCGSHLQAVTVFHGSLFCMYVRLPPDQSGERSKIIALFYPSVSPMLNPIIYSLRNKDVKQAFQKRIRRKLQCLFLYILNKSCIYGNWTQV